MAEPHRNLPGEIPAHLLEFRIERAIVALMGEQADPRHLATRIVENRGARAAQALRSRRLRRAEPLDAPGRTARARIAGELQAAQSPGRVVGEKYSAQWPGIPRPYTVRIATSSSPAAHT